MAEPHGAPQRPHHRTVVDGVPVLWADLATDPTVTLLFGVGLQDMDPRTVGITHLVEHLVMRRVGRVDIPHNAESTLRSTSFYATGRPDQHVDFVDRACRAVRELSTVTPEEVDLERRTVLAEVGRESLYAAHDAFTVRYGPSGTGVAALSHTRLMDWTIDEVRETAARWFHRDNAVLVSTAPLPEGLRLELPSGPPVARLPHPPSALPGPSWAEHSSDELVLSGECSTEHDDATRILATAVLTEALNATLRTAQGDVYTVQSMAVQIDDVRDVLTIAADPGPERVCDVLVTALDVLERLAVSGPGPDELERARAVLANELDLVASHAWWLDLAASYELRGFAASPPGEVSERLPLVSGRAVASVLAELRSTLLVCLPAGHAPHDEALARLAKDRLAAVSLLDDTTPVPRRGGSRHKARLFSPARGSSVRLLEDRFVLADPGATYTIRHQDVLLAGVDEDGDVELVTARGASVVLVPAFFRNLAAPLAGAVDRLGPTVRYVKSTAAGKTGDPAPVPAR